MEESQGFLWGLLVGSQHEVWVLGFLIGLAHTCEPWNLSFPGHFVQTFYIARLANRKGSFHVHLEEICWTYNFPGLLSGFAGRGYKTYDGYNTGLQEQAGDLGNPTNILLAILLAKTKIPIDSCADAIAVEQEGKKIFPEEAALKCQPESTLTGTRQAGKPDDFAALTKAKLAFVPGDHGIGMGK